MRILGYLCPGLRLFVQKCTHKIYLTNSIGGLPATIFAVVLRMGDRESEDGEIGQEDANIQRTEYQGEEKVIIQTIRSTGNLSQHTIYMKLNSLVFSKLNY
jgi:hypothetical protein